jgi:hypothetical protein
MTREFTRRDVNRALLATAVALASGGAAVLPRLPQHLFDFAIAGGHYHALAAELPNIAAGSQLILRREPDNPYDANAIAVHTPSGAMLGFVPRVANEPLAALLDGGRVVRARVLRLLSIADWTDIPDDLVFTSVASGDPVVRLMLEP